MVLTFLNMNHSLAFGNVTRNVLDTILVHTLISTSLRWKQRCSKAKCFHVSSKRFTYLTAEYTRDGYRMKPMILNVIPNQWAHRTWIVTLEVSRWFTWKKWKSRRCSISDTNFFQMKEKDVTFNTLWCIESIGRKLKGATKASPTY